MIGRRIPDDEWFHWQADGLIQAGDYGKIPGDPDGWFVCAPDGMKFMLANTASPDSAGRVHEVEEHEDGTITVEPRPNNSNSILSPRGWHGYIHQGVWSGA
jgi:hypothetical protein